MIVDVMDAKKMILNNLPPNHILRNTPLIDLGAKYKSIGFISHQEVTHAYGLAKARVTFNQLGEVWTNGTEWIATKGIE